MPRLPTRPVCVPLAWARPLLVGPILTISLPPWRPLQAPTDHPQCTVKASYSPFPPRFPARVHRQAQVTDERLLVGRCLLPSSPSWCLRHCPPVALTQPGLPYPSPSSTLCPLVTPARPGCSRAAYPAPRLSPGGGAAAQQFLLRPGGGCARLPQREN